jgi:hypothetical protein
VEDPAVTYFDRMGVGMLVVDLCRPWDYADTCLPAGVNAL